MKPDPKDHPGEWRKSALLTALGLAILSSILRWRHVLSRDTWSIVLFVLGLAALASCWQPRWFRGYHRFSMRVGLAISQFLGRLMLIVFFFLILMPVGMILRLVGKDALELKPRRGATTGWQAAKDYSPLDRLF